MARGAAATAQRDDHDAQQGDSKASKRRCIQSACVPCRRRKSKCDGGTPVCATCTAVYKTSCHYDAESESRRSRSSAPSGAAAASIKRDAGLVAPVPAGNLSSAELIVNSLRELPDEHVFDFVQHLRKDPNADLAALADSWRRNVTLPSTSLYEGQSLESDLSMLLGKPAVTITGESRHFGHSASLGLVSEDQDYGRQARISTMDPQRRGTTWTSVTNNLEFVNRLFTLYFTWCHPFFIIFSRESFYRDFEDGRDKYCSSLLVNAICAYACHLTDDPAARLDSSNFRTAGDHFFAEAKRLLDENDSPSLTTTQALCLMAMREPSTGRDSPGFGYIGRCIRMCVELGLHLNSSASPTLGLTPSEIEVRKVTFWGCFTVDTAWSVCTGRIAQLPRAAITLEKPILEEPSELPEANLASPRIVTTRMFLQEFAVFSELVNDNNYMFFAPKERLTSTRLLDCYHKYQAWYRRLPSNLRMEGRQQPEPHILVLHMLYYTIIVHLFRPMLKVELIHSDIRPRDICIDAANKVSGIIRIYRSMYGLRTAHLLIPHMLLTTCVVHLLYSRDSKVAYQNLVEGLQSLEEVQVCHYFGARSFRIIHSLSKTWNLPWPDELRNSELLPKHNANKPHETTSPPSDPLLFAPSTANHIRNPKLGALSQGGDSQRRGSLSMFGPGSIQLATHLAASRSNSVASGSHIQSPSVGHTPTQPSFIPPGMAHNQFSYASIPPSSVSMPTASGTSMTDAAENIFWTPIAGMPAPILPRTNYAQMSPMGLGNLLHTDTDDRLGRDGFKINEDWHQSAMDNYASGPNSFLDRDSNSYHSSDGRAFQQTRHDTHVHTTGAEEFDPGWWSNGGNAPN